MPPGFVWFCAAVLIVVGLVGSAVPALPGAPLIFLAAVVLEVFQPQYLAAGTLVALGALTFVSVASDFALTAAGGRTFGATARGAAGAAAGALVGLLFGPAGLFLGAFAGAAAAELLWAKRDPEAALKAALGAWLGLLASSAVKIVIAFAMTVIFLVDCFLI